MGAGIGVLAWAQLLDLEIKITGVGEDVVVCHSRQSR